MILIFYKLFFMQETVSFVFLTTYSPYSLVSFIHKCIIFHLEAATRGVLWKKMFLEI